MGFGLIRRVREGFLEEGIVELRAAGRSRACSRNWQRPGFLEPTGRWWPRPCRTSQALEGTLVFVLRALGNRCRVHCWSRHDWVENCRRDKSGCGETREGQLQLSRQWGYLV